MTNDASIRAVDDALASVRLVQGELDRWHEQQQSRLDLTRAELSRQIGELRSHVEGRERTTAEPSGAQQGLTPPHAAAPVEQPAFEELDFDALVDQLEDEAAPAGGPAANTDHAAAAALPGDQPGGLPEPVAAELLARLDAQPRTGHVRVAREEHGRYLVEDVTGGPLVTPPSSGDLEPGATARVLVCFKRRRALVFTGVEFISPGQYVAVGDDCDEDVGVVLGCWVEAAGAVSGVVLDGSTLPSHAGIGRGRVRRALPQEELGDALGARASFERRAVQAAVHRVLELSVPMVIVDAEYQYDKGKLTFFYEAQQRLDYQELISDLCKAFKTRIVMVALEPTNTFGQIN